MYKLYSVSAKCVFKNAIGYRYDLKNVYQVAGLSIRKSLTQLHRCLSSAVYLHDRANHLQKNLDVTVYIPDKSSETHRCFSTTAYLCKKTNDNKASPKESLPDNEKELTYDESKTNQKDVEKQPPLRDPRIVLSTVSKDLNKPLSKEANIPMKYETIDKQNEIKVNVKSDAIGISKTKQVTNIEKVPPSQPPPQPQQKSPQPPTVSRAESDKAIIKQNAVGDIVVKTEVQKDKVTKVTIEKSKPPEVEQEETPAVKVQKRLLIDFSASYTERNFITPMRAMTEYLLKQSELESLPKVLRRSPYESAPPMTVYYRKDVEAKAIAIWGSKEALEKELLRREIDRRRYEQDVFTVKRRLRIYRREMTHKKTSEGEGVGLRTRSGRVVLTAVAINGCNFVFKLCAWLYTGSHSMFSESIHSLADTINQLILAYGIHKSVQMADTNHPYGYTNMRYVSSLISGVGIFCVGSGLSIYHGITGLFDPEPLTDYFWAYFVLGGAVVSEGATLVVALSAIRKGAKEADMSLSEYVLRSSDPSVNVVLLEDTAAVAGVVAAGGCMALAQYAGSPLPDAAGSLLVGSLLGGVASFIILTNVGALVGRSIRQEQLDEINNVLERDFMIRAIHDVKGIDMGSNLIRYKAEVDFDGRALTRSYLEKHDLNALLQDMKKIETIDDVEGFMLRHGENIVDMLGGEIDRIELKLRKKFPQIRHCDLEIL